VLYALTPRYSLYASYADIYQSAGPVRRSGGDLLRPADGVVIETGIKGAWREGLLNGTLAVYRIRQYGLPRFDASALPGSPFTPGCCYVPDASRTSKGVDAELSGTFAPGWLLGAGYTFNNNRDDNRAQLSRETPKHLMNLWVSGQLPGGLRRFTVGATLHAQSGNSKSGTVCPLVHGFPDCSAPLIFVDEQASYAVVDLRAGYQVDSHWRAAVSVGNLFDRSYLETVGFPNGDNWYGEPRTFLFRLDGRY
jgi:outer membrane receptor for ferric coprogen and ferric-rhodotorulic acid